VASFSIRIICFSILLPVASTSTRVVAVKIQYVRAFVYPLLILCAVTPKMLVVINFLNEKLLCAVLDDRWTIEWSRALQSGNYSTLSPACKAALEVVEKRRLCTWMIYLGP
jgi:hypothetical protein